MMNRYEALLGLDLRGKEDGAKETIDRLEKELEAEGAKIEQVQRLEKRPLAYEHDHQTAAYFVNFIFEGAPTMPEKLRQKFTLDAAVTLQHYQKLPAKKAGAKN